MLLFFAVIGFIVLLPIMIRVAAVVIVAAILLVAVGVVGGAGYAAYQNLKPAGAHHASR